MTVQEFLKTSTNTLVVAGIATARLDCLVLLEDALGKDRSWILAHPEYLLQGRTLSKLNAQVERRAGHEPLAYIGGKSEFYGREFLVNAHTLEPRPETETMIDLLKNLFSASERVRPLHVVDAGNPRVRPLTDGGNTDLVILDVGTGSGCLGVTAKLEIPAAVVLATDIDGKCIEIAKQNAQKLDAEVKFYQCNLLQPLSALSLQLSAILANLPYVPDSHTINRAAMFEPKHAIFGGEDGLDLYRELFGQVTNIWSKAEIPKYVFAESLPFQHKELIQIAKSAGYKLKTSEDFIQLFMSS